MPILYGINRLLRIFPYIQPIMHMLTNSARLVPTLFVINRLLRIFLYIQPIMHMCAACTGVCAKHMHSLHTVLPATSFLCTQDHQLQLGFTAQKPFTYYVHTCAWYMHPLYTAYSAPIYPLHAHQPNSIPIGLCGIYTVHIPAHTTGTCSTHVPT